MVANMINNFFKFMQNYKNEYNSLLDIINKRKKLKNVSNIFDKNNNELHTIDNKDYIKGSNFIIDKDRSLVYYDNNVVYNIDISQYNLSNILKGKGTSVEIYGAAKHIYSGDFLDGKKHGNGVVYFYNGEKNTHKLYELCKNGILYWQKQVDLESNVSFSGYSNNYRQFNKNNITYRNPVNKNPIVLNIDKGNITKNSNLLTPKDRIVLSQYIDERIYEKNKNAKKLIYQIDMHGFYDTQDNCSLLLPMLNQDIVFIE